MTILFSLHMFEVLHKKNNENTLNFNSVSANYKFCDFGQVVYSPSALIFFLFYVPVNPEILQSKNGMS